MWQAWVNFILGALIFLVAIFVESPPTWIYWIGGLLIAIISLFQAIGKKE